jgi:hypothetical protein
MPSQGVCRLAKDFGETLESVNPCKQKCAPEVCLSTARRTCNPSALLFFTIPNFRTGGRAALAPVW